MFVALVLLIEDFEKRVRNLKHWDLLLQLELKVQGLVVEWRYLGLGLVE